MVCLLVNEAQAAIAAIAAAAETVKEEEVGRVIDVEWIRCV